MLALTLGEGPGLPAIMSIYNLLLLGLWLYHKVESERGAQTRSPGSQD